MDERSSAFCNCLQGLKPTLLGLAGAALCHKVVSQEHVVLGLLNLISDRLSSSLDHSSCIVSHLVAFIPLFVLWVIIWHYSWFDATQFLLGLHSPYKLCWLISPKLGRRDVYFIQVVPRFDRLQVIHWIFRLVWLSDPSLNIVLFQLGASHQHLWADTHIRCCRNVRLL